MTKDYTNALGAEFVGVFTLCFIGILAIGGPGIGGGEATGLLGVALAHALALVVMIGGLGHISGAHFNPAVTVGLLLIKRIDGGKALAYILAQLAGACAASFLLAGLFGGELVAGGTPALSANVPFTTGLVLEVIATFFLALVIVMSAVDKRAPAGMFPLLIGLTVAADILAIGPLTGAAMNPARVFGPALASGAWANHALYWIGPLIGGALGALTAQWYLPDAKS